MNIDQELADTRDSLSRLWRAVYAGNLAAGFTPEQAMFLTQSFVVDICTTFSGRGVVQQKPEDE